MKQRITIIGGDARYLELIRQLQLLPNIELYLIGYDQLEQGFTGLNQLSLDELNTDLLDILILPITGIDKNGQVETVFSNKKIILTKEWFKKLQKTIVFTGIANHYLKEAVETADIELISLLDRDDVAIYNSIPTAEGTIMMAMENTDYTLHSAHVTITGFGRVGQTVANRFHALGSKVAVSSNSEKELARISEIGYQAIPLNKLAKRSAMTDILINTIPARVVTEQVIQQLPPHGLIIDLASKPGGTDFKYAHRRGVQAILAKSLPGTVAPKTAGKILAKVIKQYVGVNQANLMMEGRIL